jgi:hypothetical protein
MNGNLCSDHEHCFLSIPPKFVVSSVIRYIKIKSAVSIAKNFTCESFRQKSYCVLPIGIIMNVIFNNELDEDGCRASLGDQRAILEKLSLDSQGIMSWDTQRIYRTRVFVSGIQCC